MEQQLERMIYRAAMEIESVKAAARAQMEIHEAREKELEAQLKEARRETEELKQQLFLLKQGWNNMPSFLSQSFADQKNCYGECDPFAEEDSLSMPLSLESGGSSMDCGRNNSSDSGGSRFDQSSFCSGLDEILPQKGRLLQAVIEAGPLLQNLLMAGPLPNWRHPPPCLSHFDIPQVSVSAAAASSSIFLPRSFPPNHFIC